MGGLRVLVVDDQPRARRSVRALLAARHLAGEVQEAANGREALGLVEQFRPDVVLMDMRMPEMDGLEATRQIKAKWASVKVFVLSLYGDREEEALAAGADAFFCKTQPPEKLLATLAGIAQEQEGEIP
jgi:CheY-like chemotaxis protein